MIVLLTKYYADDLVKKSEMGRACRTYKGEERCMQGLGGKPEGRRPIGRLRNRWGDSIKMDLQEVEWGVWNGLMWLRIGVCSRLL
jgi:hypothetical protein